MPFILASASPRRTQLLTQLGIVHQVMPVDIDESPNKGEDAQTLVTRLASEKAAVGYQVAYERNGDDVVVLAADTLISLDGKPLGKPADQNDCKAMLTALANRTHQVLTAVSIKNTYRQHTQCIATDVEFGPMTDEDIQAYWQTGEPQDKAGSYGIQGLGAQFVKRINGSYSAVVGLPLFEVRQMLKEFEVIK